MVDNKGAGSRATSRPRAQRHVLGVPIDVVDADEAVRRVRVWASNRESRYACFCNVHSVVTASQDPAFMKVVAGADLAAPDGAPVAWTMRRLGAVAQRRVSGPDFMLRYVRQASAVGETVYLYGNSEGTLAALQSELRRKFPQLVIAGAHSPPFRALTLAEDEADVRRINESGASTVWVSLGCPKQEHWMSQHRGRVHAVMLGVGAAFDFHAGTVQRAPNWMRAWGLEWLHRVASEPGRLWKRYLVTNTAFIVGVARQLLPGRGSSAG